MQVIKKLREERLRLYHRHTQLASTDRRCRTSHGEGVLSFDKTALTIFSHGHELLRSDLERHLTRLTRSESDTLESSQLLQRR